jgi:hypothetical protein
VKSRRKSAQNARRAPPVYPSFIEEMTRLNIKPGVSRQKLV